MSPCRRFAVLVAGLGAVAGCAAAVDAGQARLCRAVIPALNTTGSAVEIVRTAPLVSGHGVRLDYRVASSTGERSRFVECRFAAGQQASPANAR